MQDEKLQDALDRYAGQLAKKRGTGMAGFMGSKGGDSIDHNKMMRVLMELMLRADTQERDDTNYEYPPVMPVPRVTEYAHKYVERGK